MARKRTIALILGVFSGLGGATHGPGEMLQGNVAPDNLYIEAWPSLTALNGEPAMTIIPSYLIAGILTIILGLLVALWAAKYIDRKNGGIIMIMLTATMLLVGGGLAPPLFGFASGIIMMRVKDNSKEMKPVRC